MKTLALLLLLALPLEAQTNLGTITFTNKNGLVISNAEVVSVSDNKLIWRRDTAGGGVSLADLPYDLQTRFGYDVVRATRADWSEREKRDQTAKVTATRNEEVTRLAKAQQRVREVAATTTGLHGAFVQKLEKALLLDAEHPETARGVHYRCDYLPPELMPEYQTLFKSEKIDRRHWAWGFVLLEDFKCLEDIGDNDAVNIPAYPIGNYEYTARSGLKKVVHKYTASFERALREQKPEHLGN